MIDFTTVGRPYAQAAFEYAKENRALDDWQSMLSALAGSVQHPEVAMLLKNPSYRAEQHVDLCCALLRQIPSVPQQNFIKLLAENARLLALPAIFTLFLAFRAKAENVLPVTVKTAIPLDNEDLGKVNSFLVTKFNREIALKTEVDENLIAGLVVRAGDYVIDASIRGQLEKLKKCVVN